MFLAKWYRADLDQYKLRLQEWERSITAYRTERATLFAALYQTTSTQIKDKVRLKGAHWDKVRRACDPLGYFRLQEKVTYGSSNVALKSVTFDTASWSSTAATAVLNQVKQHHIQIKSEDAATDRAVKIFSPPYFPSTPTSAHVPTTNAATVTAAALPATSTTSTAVSGGSYTGDRQHRVAFATTSTTTTSAAAVRQRSHGGKRETPTQSDSHPHKQPRLHTQQDARPSNFKGRRFLCRICRTEVQTHTDKEKPALLDICSFCWQMHKHQLQHPHALLKTSISASEAPSVYGFHPPPAKLSQQRK